MDDEKAHIENDSKGSEEEISAEDDGLIVNLKKTMREHKDAHETLKEHKKMFKSLPRYDRKLLKGIIRGPGKIMMLWIIGKGRVHGYEIMTQLHGTSQDGEKIKMPSPSMIYPILHDLEKHGLIEGTWEYQGKRKLKYYEITDEGVETLSRIRNMYKNRENTLLEEFMKDMFFKYE